MILRGLLTMVLTGAQLLPCAATPDSRPNILFVMSDDHTCQAIGAYGSRLATLDPTPTIDRLAHNGMRFVPALGTAVARDQHLTLRPVSVSRSGESLLDVIVKWVSV